MKKLLISLLIVNLLLVISYFHSKHNVLDTAILISDNINLKDAMYITSNVAKEEDVSFKVTIKFNLNKFTDEFGYILYPRLHKVVLEQRLDL
jgi:hypothetical protein